MRENCWRDSMKTELKKLLISIVLCAVALVALNVTDVQAAAKKYTVTFVYGNNVNTQQVKAGKNAVVPTNTDVPGFIFAGWTDTAANIQCDKVILGMYTPVAQPAKKNAVRPVHVNNDLSAPGEPWWDYSLKGEPGKTCVIRWYNGSNGELWKTEVVPYGTTLDDPADPCISGYDFVGWVGSWENITEDRNIMAWYFHKNKVDFVDSQTGKVYASEWVRDEMPVKAPEKNPKHDGLDFDGYDTSLKKIEHDTTIDALYKKD